MKKRNKENDSFYGQICVKFMGKKTNCENNLELILLETYNLLDGYMRKELFCFEHYRMGWNTPNVCIWFTMAYTYTYYLATQCICLT